MFCNGMGITLPAGVLEARNNQLPAGICLVAHSCIGGEPMRAATVAKDDGGTNYATTRVYRRKVAGALFLPQPARASARSGLRDGSLFRLVLTSIESCPEFGKEVVMGPRNPRHPLCHRWSNSRRPRHAECVITQSDVDTSQRDGDGLEACNGAGSTCGVRGYRSGGARLGGSGSGRAACKGYEGLHHCRS